MSGHRPTVPVAAPWGKASALPPGSDGSPSWGPQLSARRSHAFNYFFHGNQSAESVAPAILSPVV